MSKSTSKLYPGIPASLTLEFAENWVTPRISSKRFGHTKGVAKCARKLAKAAHEDAFLAELAGWLHDACKEFKEPELLKLAEHFQMQLHPVEKLHPHLLHGPIAALVAKEELGLTNQAVLDAITQHTLGAIAMAPLSQIVYLADCLEDSRLQQYTKPIWEALDVDGNLDFERALIVASDLNLQHLIESGRPIHPLTVEVRNYYLERWKKRD